jgi:hypothetical protein
LAFSLTTLSTNGFFATFSITKLCHYAECCVLFIVMLNVIMLSVVMLNVIMLNVVTLKVAAPQKDLCGKTSGLD